MKRSSLLIVILCSITATAALGSDRPDKVTIPLNKIWAYDLPGTRDITALAEGDDTTLVVSIVRSWHNRTPWLEDHDVPRPGFAVSGGGLAALKAAHMVLVETATPRNAFSPNEEITLVLFSELATKQVQISEVKREGTRVMIQYRLVLPEWKGRLPANLALVPLGKLPAGKYLVEMQQIPSDQVGVQPGLKPIDVTWSRKYLSRPFSFNVEKGIIPLDRIWAYEMPWTRNLVDMFKGENERVDSMLLNAALELNYERAERLKFHDLARPGFAVAGEGHSALRAAFAVFIDWGAKRERFSPEDKVTVVFFSEPISRYPIQIRQVKRNDKTIQIQYELVPDVSRGSHVNFALIPLGKLPVGRYRVEMRQVPRELTDVESKLGFKPLDEEWSRKFLCEPFEFTVKKRKLD